MDGAALGGRGRRLGHGSGARQGYGRDPVEAMDAQHFLDQIGLALHVGAPGRNAYAQVIAARSR